MDKKLSDKLKTDILICAHRGDNSKYKENTIQAMQYAMKLGVDMIETDIRMSKDNVLFLMHDNIGLEEKTIDEIMYFDDQIALLEDFLNLAQQYPEVILNLEFKNPPKNMINREEHSLIAVEKTTKMLLEASVEGRSLINSFNGALVEHVYNKYGNTFAYHTFYPWQYNVNLSLDPKTFCSVVCPLNWSEMPDGTKYLDQEKMKSEVIESLKETDMAIIVSSSEKDKDFQNLERLLTSGGSIVMADCVESVITHCKGRKRIR